MHYESSPYILEELNEVLMLVTGGVLHVDIIVGVPGLVPRPLQPRPQEGAGLDQLPRLRLPDGDVVLQQTCQPCLTMFGSESSIIKEKKATTRLGRLSIP